MFHEQDTGALRLRVGGQPQKRRLKGLACQASSASPYSDIACSCISPAWASKPRAFVNLSEFSLLEVLSRRDCLVCGIYIPVGPCLVCYSSALDPAIQQCYHTFRLVWGIKWSRQFCSLVDEGLQPAHTYRSSPRGLLSAKSISFRHSLGGSPSKTFSPWSRCWPFLVQLNKFAFASVKHCSCHSLS